MNEAAMTIPEQAVEAATKALAPHISGFERDMLSPHQQKDISETARLVLSAALPFMGVERAALPPLRAREEIPEDVVLAFMRRSNLPSRAILEMTVTEWKDGIDIQRPSHSTMEFARALFTAGQEWRDMQTYTEVCRNEKCPRGGKPVTIVAEKSEVKS